MLAKDFFDAKRQIRPNGNFLRPKVILKEKHMPLKLAEVSEPSRIKDAIDERGSVSLRESFNMQLYEHPVWKSVEKKKWRGDKRGISYEGQLGKHVST